MNIVVLCGGTSTEREVSLSSSEKVANALRNRGHNVVVIDVFWGAESMPSFDEPQDISAVIKEYRGLTGLITDELKAEREYFGPNVYDICKKADMVFLGLHGADGEDGKVQAAFDLMKIKYTGSNHLGSSVAMSKEHTKKIISGLIRTVPGTVVTRENPFRERIPVPCVVKPNNGGSSVGVIIVEKEEDYDAAVLECLKYDDTVVIEKYVNGRELTQGVLDGKALPPVEIIPAEGFYDYKNKYSGETLEVCPAQIGEDVLDLMSRYSVLAGKIIGLSVYYRMDYLLDKDGTLYCLEANSLPGMTNTSLVPQEAAAIGMEYAELCEKIIELSLAKYEK